jgi:hypothetical protein
LFGFAFALALSMANNLAAYSHLSNEVLVMIWPRVGYNILGNSKASLGN